MVTRWFGKFCAELGAAAIKLAAKAATTPSQSVRSMLITFPPKKFSTHPIQWVAAPWEAIKAGTQFRVYE
jgi:hypothetical protein